MMDRTHTNSLNLYQKRQAALLYYFSSMEHLDKIIGRVRALTVFTDQTLDYAIRMERDRAMREVGWDEGNLASNWSTHAHPMLRDCLRGLLSQKSKRATEWYDISGVSGTLTGMSHFSMNWTLPEEEQKFLELSGEAIDVGVDLDSTVEHTFTDLDMELSWEVYKHLFPKMPKFRIRSDVQGETGKRPVRTGVYVPQDDPFGTLQFAWTGNSSGTLAPCETLSELALEYVNVVGRNKLWKSPSEKARNPDRAEPTDEYFDDWCRESKRMKFPDEISSRNERAFSNRSCKWYFVEQIFGEFEDETPEVTQTSEDLRCAPGATVPRSGWWYSPAIPGEPGFRYFDQGARFPGTATTEWGAVLWYYEAHRQKMI